jgi:hypothetical protein
MKGSQESLTTVVVKDATNWATPAARDTQGQRGAAANARKGNPLDTLPNQMAVYGLPAPANPSTDGSRQGLWPTARSLDGQVGESLETWEARHQRKAAEGINLHRPLPIAVEQEQRKQWATPRAGKTTDENPETWAARQANGDVATMPLTAQVKTWQTATVSTGAHRQKDGSMIDKLDQQVKSWATPRAEMDSGAHNGIPDTLHSQMKVQAVGKLNPRWVETLMNLPVGWTMPSCASPVTIAPTNFDSSATVLSRPQQNGPSEC